MSHPTVGVARLGSKVSDRLNSLSEELAVGMKKLLVYHGIRFRTSAYLWRSGGANNFFQVLYQVRYWAPALRGSGTSGAPLPWDGSRGLAHTSLRRWLVSCSVLS